MIEDAIILLAGLLLLIATVVNLYRLLRGPTVVDRSLALDMSLYLAMGASAWIAFRGMGPTVWPFVLITCFLAFAGALAFGWFLNREAPETAEGDAP